MGFAWSTKLLGSYLPAFVVTWAPPAVMNSTFPKWSVPERSLKMSLISSVLKSITFMAVYAKPNTQSELYVQLSTMQPPEPGPVCVRCKTQNYSHYEYKWNGLAQHPYEVYVCQWSLLSPILSYICCIATSGRWAFAPSSGWTLLPPLTVCHRENMFVPVSGNPTLNTGSTGYRCYWMASTFLLIFFSEGWIHIRYLIYSDAHNPLNSFLV